MSKKYIVKRKINKRNTFILLVILISIIFVCFQLIKNIFFKEESVIAGDSIKNELNINTQEHDNNGKNVSNKNTRKEETDNKQEDIKEIKKTHFKVVIDASYGGHDGGSKGYNGIIQKNINLEIALKIKDILEKQNDVDVILTRKDDSTVSMEERLEIINSSDADFIVSIMQNTEGTGDVSGVESYVLPKEQENSNSTLGYTLQQAMTMYIDTKDRGVLARNMEILMKSNIPGVVVNTGFISNKTEGTNLASEKYQLRMAEGISQGILSYIDKHLKK